MQQTPPSVHTISTPNSPHGKAAVEWVDRHGWHGFDLRRGLLRLLSMGEESTNASAKPFSSLVQLGRQPWHHPGQHSGSLDAEYGVRGVEMQGHKCWVHACRIWVAVVPPVARVGRRVHGVGLLLRLLLANLFELSDKAVVGGHRLVVGAL